jgi:hypothetical protein
MGDLTRRGRLKNGNPPGDFFQAPRCHAKTRRGTACLSPAMANGRCRMHGGSSTGPKTAEGRERIRRASTKHGIYSAAFQREQQKYRDLMRESRGLLRKIREGEV